MGIFVLDGKTLQELEAHVMWRAQAMGILSTLGMRDVPSLEMRHSEQVIPNIGILVREWDMCVVGGGGGEQFK